jgi:benzoyl-CoA reductase subunit C
MTTNVHNAITTVDKYYQDYGVRAKELAGQGKKVIGYLCAFTPVEFITAAGFVPLRIKGSVSEPITKADTNMETIICPLVRSCYDMTLKGKYSYISGMIIPHACDSICRTYDIWKATLNLPYTHLLNMPHCTDASSMTFFKEILNTFKTSLGKFAGKEITDTALTEAVKVHNENRSRVRALLELRKQQPALISGTEMTKILVASISLPVDESNKLLSDVLNEVKLRKPESPKSHARIMVIGAQVDDAAFIKVIEDSGASVVIDDLCPGTREFWADAAVTANPIDGLSERYLEKVKCGRTYREEKGDYKAALEDRYGHLKEFARDFKVNGVVLYIYKYCDSFGFEVPALKSYIQSLNIPVLYIEDEYSMSTISRLKTRVQAFLEMLG